MHEICVVQKVVRNLARYAKPKEFETLKIMLESGLMNSGILFLDNN